MTSSLGLVTRSLSRRLEFALTVDGHEPMVISYSAMNLRQTIRINDEVQWWRFSWIWFQRSAKFERRNSRGIEQRWMFHLRIDPLSLKIRRLAVYVDAELVYGEEYGQLLTVTV